VVGVEEADVEVGLTVEDGGGTDEEDGPAEDEDGAADDEDGPDGADPASGPAIAVVIGACSTYMPDQYQSSAEAFVPPFGNLNTPICQSSEFVDGDPAMPDMICVSGADPLDAQSPIWLVLKLTS
jgi:hypothetical protein